MNTIVPVSYTHLDVYKRQYLNYVKSEEELSLNYLRKKEI